MKLSFPRALVRHFILICIICVFLIELLITYTPFDNLLAKIVIGMALGIVFGCVFLISRNTLIEKARAKISKNYKVSKSSIIFKQHEILSITKKGKVLHIPYSFVKEYVRPIDCR